MRITSQILSKVGDLTKHFSNFPESYVKRSMEQVSKIALPGVQSMSLYIRCHLRCIGEHLEENQIIFQELWKEKSSVLPLIVHGLVNLNNKICRVQ